MQFTGMLRQVKQTLHITFHIQISSHIGLSKANQILVQHQVAQHRRLVDNHCARRIDIAVDALTTPQAHRNRPIIACQETLQDFPCRNNLRVIQGYPGQYLTNALKTLFLLLFSASFSVLLQ